MARLPEILSRHDFSPAELSGARLDGEVYALDECWVPVDEPDGAALRARAASERLSGRAIAWRHTAAWVHGARSTPPAAGEYCLGRGQRISLATLSDVVVSEAVVDPSEVVDFGGSRVTTPARTLEDLLRDATMRDAAVLPLAAALVRLTEISVDEVTRVLAARKRHPHKRLALARLGELRRRQPSLTR